MHQSSLNVSLNDPPFFFHCCNIVLIMVGIYSYCLETNVCALPMKDWFLIG